MERIERNINPAFYDYLNSFDKAHYRDFKNVRQIMDSSCKGLRQRDNWADHWDTDKNLGKVAMPENKVTRWDSYTQKEITEKSSMSLEFDPKSDSVKSDKYKSQIDRYDKEGKFIASFTDEKYTLPTGDTAYIQTYKSPEFNKRESYIVNNKGVLTYIKEEI